MVNRAVLFYVIKLLEHVNKWAFYEKQGHPRTHLGPVVPLDHEPNYI